jgi:hypothetical protein
MQIWDFNALQKFSTIVRISKNLVLVAFYDQKGILIQMFSFPARC